MVHHATPILTRNLACFCRHDVGKWAEFGDDENGDESGDDEVTLCEWQWLGTLLGGQHSCQRNSSTWPEHSIDGTLWWQSKCERLWLDEYLLWGLEGRGLAVLKLPIFKEVFGRWTTYRYRNSIKYKSETISIWLINVGSEMSRTSIDYSNWNWPVADHMDAPDIVQCLFVHKWRVLAYYLGYWILAREDELCQSTNKQNVQRKKDFRTRCHVVNTILLDTHNFGHISDGPTCTLGHRMAIMPVEASTRIGFISPFAHSSSIRHDWWLTNFGRCKCKLKIVWPFECKQTHRSWQCLDRDTWRMLEEQNGESKTYLDFRWRSWFEWLVELERFLFRCNSLWRVVWFSSDHSSVKWT